MFEYGVEYKEYLICDFELEIGDIIQNYPYYYDLLTNIEPTDITTNSNGIKQYHFNNDGITYQEGLGPLSGITHPFTDHIFGHYTGLFCHGDFENQNNCEAVLSSEEFYHKNSISFYPNPVIDNLHLENLPVACTNELPRGRAIEVSK